MRGWQGVSNYVHVFDFEGILAVFVKAYPSGVVSVDMIAILCMCSKAVAESPFMEVTQDLRKIKMPFHAMTWSWTLPASSSHALDYM